MSGLHQCKPSATHAEREAVVHEAPAPRTSRRIGHRRVRLLRLAATAPGRRQQFQSERQAWEARARSVTIMRDDWGIAHVHGKTDADAVFGVIYAQAEDDFNRVETNYLDAWAASPRPRASRRSGRTCA